MTGLGSERKWESEAAARRYASVRFRGARAAGRDPRLVERALRCAGVRGAILDVPCGAGRLQPTLASFGAPLVGLDVSRSMLAAARADGAHWLVQASVERLPFADRAFDAVVCCRLLHHLDGEAELDRAARELVRVARRLVLASFWDAASLPEWRRRLGLKPGEGARGRRATSRAAIAAAFERAGATPVEFRATLRFVSQQTWIVVERR